MGRCPFPVTPSRRDARSRGCGGAGQTRGSPVSSSSFRVPPGPGETGSRQGPAQGSRWVAGEAVVSWRVATSGGSSDLERASWSLCLDQGILPAGGSLPVGQVVSCPEAGTAELETASQRTSQPPVSWAAHWRRLTRWNKAAIALRNRKNNKYHFLTVDPMFSKSFTYI